MLFSKLWYFLVLIPLSFQSRTAVYKILESEGIEIPRFAILDRNDPLSELCFHISYVDVMLSFVTSSFVSSDVISYLLWRCLLFLVTSHSITVVASLEFFPTSQDIQWRTWLFIPDMFCYVKIVILFQY